MKKLLYFFLGFTVFKIDSSYVKELYNIANRYNIKILYTTLKKEQLTVRIYTKSEKLLFEEFNKADINYRICCRKGIREIIKRYRHRIGLIAGITLLFVSLYVSPLFVWEINVTGLETLSHEYVCDLLESEGVFIGAFSPAVDRKEVYRNIVRTSNDISWISVNFIGSSANVEIVERDYTSTAKVNADAANIIAAKSGEIVDTEVISGKRTVENGNIVEKGDILVSGVYETGKMGTRYVYANAKVFAKVSEEFIVEIPLEGTNKHYDSEFVVERSVKIFGKSLNIFKNYSISDENYDIINKDIKLPIPALDSLPVYIKTVCALPYTVEKVLLTESEALSLARSRFFDMIDTETDYVEILSTSESYSIKNSTLIFKCRVEAIENIAAISEFNIP